MSKDNVTSCQNGEHYVIYDNSSNRLILAIHRDHIQNILAVASKYGVKTDQRVRSYTYMNRQSVE